MKIFVSNKFKKENKKILRQKLEKILSSLEKAGHETFNLFRDMNWKVKELPPGKAISFAFEKIKKCDAILVLLDDRKETQGIYLEIGFAKALGKKIILLIFDKLSFPTLEAIADKIIRFNKFEDIERKLSNIEKQ
jgi:nucleoside 2-deoxyribosyltransferase